MLGRYMHDEQQHFRSTTILCVRKGNKVVIVGDGQVSNGYTVCKGNAVKVRKLEGEVIVGMAGMQQGLLRLTFQEVLEIV
jgi:ATP-dependent HslUV protease subunit HslV